MNKVYQIRYGEPFSKRLWNLSNRLPTENRHPSLLVIDYYSYLPVIDQYKQLDKLLESIGFATLF